MTTYVEEVRDDCATWMVEILAVSFRGRLIDVVEGKQPGRAVVDLAM